MALTTSELRSPDRPSHSSSVLHDDLLRLTQGLGGLRLAIAEEFERLGGVEWLGLPNAAAYARERLGRSGRWLGDARPLGRRLSTLPRLREASLSGWLSTSKVELLARDLVRLEHDGSERDERGAIELARSLTVRELRARLGERECDGQERARRRWVRLTRHVDRVDAMALEGAIRLMDAIGEPTRAAAVEGLPAEGLTTLLNRAAEATSPPTSSPCATAATSPSSTAATSPSPASPRRL